ncbi:endolytic transglycosylase MltG [Streptomyces sp. NPDC055078]
MYGDQGDQGQYAQQAESGHVPYGRPEQPYPQQPQDYTTQGYQQQYGQQPYGGGQFDGGHDGRQYDQGTGQQAVPQYEAGTGAVPQYGAGSGAVPQYGAGSGAVPQYGAGSGAVPQYDAGSGAVPQYDAATGQQIAPQYDQGTGPQAVPQYDQGVAQQYEGAWDPGGQAAVPYGGNPADGYGGPAPAYTGRQPIADYYATPDAYPPPEPPSRRRPEPEPSATEWEAEAPEEEKHPFFTGAGGGRGEDDDGAYDDDPGETRRRGPGNERRGKGKKKGRNGCACLVVSLVLVGGLGGAGYFGYQFWEGRFGPPEDFTGAGSGSTQVEVPQGAGLMEIGNILKKKGVVKSSGAFVSAAKGKLIEEGVYILPKGMSGKNAVLTMLDPKSRNNLIVTPGKRNFQVYAEIDKRLAIKKGTTAAVAKDKAGSLGLPAWAKGGRDIKDPLEGFLFPATYPLAKGMKPEAILAKMVAEANKAYGQQDLKAEAERLGLKSPLELLTVASLVQAEGKHREDFEKVARVVYNRLQPGNTETVGRLEFDSTVNYIKGQSRLDIGSVDKLRKIKHPYNTYLVKGLPPGPIGNPGMSAFNSALKPAPGPWYYFVSVTEDETIFAETNDEHERNRRKYEEQQEKSGQ